MSYIHFYDEGEDLPQPLPRAEVRFVEITLAPYPDARRAKLHFTLTPFLERPNVEITVTNRHGQEVASLSLIEAVETEFDFTIHLRGPAPEGEHTARLYAFYPDNANPGAPPRIVDDRTVTFTPAAA